MNFINDSNFVALTTATYIVDYKKGTKELCIKRWDLDPTKREYMDYIFAPYPFKMKNNYEYYNTWKDFSLVNYVPIEQLNPEHCVEVYNDFMLHISNGDQKVFA